MSYYVNVRNDDNPLQVYTGNDRLRVTSRHHWKADYKWNNMDKQRIFSAQIGYQLIQNAIAMGYTYDRKTGIYTYRPENVNGNNSVSGQIGFSTPLDKNKHLTLDLNTNASHLHSIDLSRESTNIALQKSTVNTTYLTQSARLNYSIKKVRIGGKSSITYTHQTSPHQAFKPQMQPISTMG